MALIVKNETKVGQPLPFKMPMTIARTGTYVKTAAGTSTHRGDAVFWSVFGLQGANTLAWTAGQERDLVDVTGEAGIVTHILCPEPLAGQSGEQRVTVIADGITYRFSQHISSGHALLVGQFDLGTPVTAVTEVTNVQHGYGRYADEGWAVSQDSRLMRPDVAYATTGIGIPFSKSLKISVYLEMASHGSLYYRNSGVSYIKTGEVV